MFFGVLFLTAIAIESCEKEKESDRECQINNSGFIKVSNSSNSGYNIYIDNVFAFQLQGKTLTGQYEVKVGVHSVKAIETIGYTSQPKIQQRNVTVDQCEYESIVFSN